ncbi:MAG TPA: ABC transporter ATP-binding protein, partial [Alphaproteobacteria bacterium]|nr:ABC transporter ATP-binding protein [Alphaproteobacteria bacterium]
MLKKVSYRDVGRFTWHYWGRQKGRLALVAAGMAVASGIDVMFPMIMGWLIDEITKAANDPALIWSSVVPLFAAFLIQGFIYHGIRNGTLFIWNGFAINNLHSIEEESFRKVQRFSSDWHANAFAGATVRKITRGKWSFDLYEDILFINLYPAILVLLLITGTMFMRWPVMGAVTLISSLLYTGINIYTVMKINAPLFRASAARDTRLGASMADSITANAVVKSFGAERREDRIFGFAMRSWRIRAFKSWQTAVMTDLLRRYLSEIMAGAMVGTAIYLWAEGQATAGDVVFVLTSFMLLSHYLRALGDQVSNLQKAMSDMEDVVSFWLREDDMRDAPGAPDLEVKSGAVEFDRVHFIYKSKTDALFDNLSVAIKPGEHIALVGHSGSGKTSFVKLLQRLYDVQGGEIRIDGQNIAAVTQESLRRNIALVQQEPILFHRSIAANIAYARPKASMDEIIQAAKQAYAHDFIAELPLGY